MASSVNIERKRGDTTPDVWTVSVRNNTTNITGCTFKFTLDKRPEPDDISTQVYQLEGVITDAANGVVEFPMTEAQANQVGYFYYDVQMTDSYGKIHTPVSGTYRYKQDITK